MSSRSKIITAIALLVFVSLIGQVLSTFYLPSQRLRTMSGTDKFLKVRSDSSSEIQKLTSRCKHIPTFSSHPRFGGIGFNGGPAYETCSGTLTIQSDQLTPGAELVIECRYTSLYKEVSLKTKCFFADKARAFANSHCLLTRTITTSPQEKAGKLTMRKVFADPVEACQFVDSLESLPSPYTSITQFLLSVPGVQTKKLLY